MPVHGLPNALESSLNNLLQHQLPTSWRVSGHNDDVTVVLRFTTKDWWSKEWVPPSTPLKTSFDYASNNDETRSNKFREHNTMSKPLQHTHSKKQKRKHSSSSSSSGKDNCPSLQAPSGVHCNSNINSNGNSTSKREKGSKSTIQRYATPQHFETDPFPVYITSAESTNRNVGHEFVEGDSSSHSRDNAYSVNTSVEADDKQRIVKMSGYYSDGDISHSNTSQQYQHHQQQPQQQQNIVISSCTSVDEGYSNNSFKTHSSSTSKGSNSSHPEDVHVFDGRHRDSHNPSSFYNAVAQALQKDPATSSSNVSRAAKGRPSSYRSYKMHRQKSFDNGGVFVERETSPMHSEDDEDLDLICTVETVEHVDCDKQD